MNSNTPIATIPHHTTIRVYIKEVYGKTLTYVQDPAIASYVQALTGTLTLTREHVKALSALGFECELCFPGDIKQGAPVRHALRVATNRPMLSANNREAYCKTPIATMVR